eukprot:3813314-Pleurochrysis_carterae.AAC.1
MIFVLACQPYADTDGRAARANWLQPCKGLHAATLISSRQHVSRWNNGLCLLIRLKERDGCAMNSIN